VGTRDQRPTRRAPPRGAPGRSSPRGGAVDDRSLLEQILHAWRVNNAINVKLIRGIPAGGFDVVPPASRGRTVAKQLAHMHNVHSGWMKLNGVRVPREAGPLPLKSKLDRARLAAAFRATGPLVEAYVRERLTSGKRIRFFRGKPILWLCYILAHDAHHRGQIALALKQNGKKLPESVALRDIWYSWYSGRTK